MKANPVDRGVTRFKMQLCPYCGYHFDAAGTADGSEGTPGEGDASICLNCAEIMVFTGSDLMRKPTADEQKAFREDPEWSDLLPQQAKLRAMQRHGFQTAQAKRNKRSQ